MKEGNIIRRIVKRVEREKKEVSEELREEIGEVFEGIQKKAQEKENKKIKKKIGDFLEKLKEREVKKGTLFSLLRFLTKEILENPDYKIGRFTSRDKTELKFLREEGELDEEEREKLKKLELREKFFQIRLKLANLITGRDLEKECRERMVTITKTYEEMSSSRGELTEGITTIKGIKEEINRIEAQIERIKKIENGRRLTLDEKAELKYWKSKLKIVLKEKEDRLSPFIVVIPLLERYIKAKIKRIKEIRKGRRLTPEEEMKLEVLKSRLEIISKEKKDMLSSLLEKFGVKRLEGLEELELEDLEKLLKEYFKIEREFTEVRRKGLVGLIEDEIEKIIE